MDLWLVVVIAVVVVALVAAYVVLRRRRLSGHLIAARSPRDPDGRGGGS